MEASLFMNQFLARPFTACLSWVTRQTVTNHDDGMISSADPKCSQPETIVLTWVFPVN